MYVAGARIEAEAYLNRALFARACGSRIAWAPPPTATPLVPQSLIVFPLDWPPLVERPIELPRAPAVSVEQNHLGGRSMICRLPIRPTMT